MLIFNYTKYEDMLTYVYDKKDNFMVALVNDSVLDTEKVKKGTMELVEFIENLNLARTRSLPSYCQHVMATSEFVDFDTDSDNISAEKIDFSDAEVERIRELFSDVILTEDETDVIYSVKAMVQVLHLIINRKDFDFYLSLLKEYKEEHAHVLVKHHEWYHGYPLGIWLYQVKNGYQQSGLETGKEKVLKDMGVVLGDWGKDGWLFKYGIASQYYKEHKNLKVPFGTVMGGFNLYSWLCFQKQRKLAGTLEADKVKKLEKIGIVWSDEVEKKWEYKYSVAEKYFKEFGNLSTSKNEQYGGIALDAWLNNQRRAKRGEKNRNITEEQIEKLNKLNMRW